MQTMFDRVEKPLYHVQRKIPIEMTSAYFNWSGGKDSALALWKIFKERKFKVEYLLTNMNGFHNRVSMHGVRRVLLETQATSLNVPLTTIELPEQPSMTEYEETMMNKINWLKEQKITHGIFGDIFLEDLKKYREDKLKTAGIQCVFPIWKMDTKNLLNEFIEEGFKAIIVCVNEKFLDKSFCGRMIDKNFLEDLPASVDACGENGEFHSFVFDGPILKFPVSFTKGEIVYKEYKAPATDKETLTHYDFYFCDLLPC